MDQNIEDNSKENLQLSLDGFTGPLDLLLQLITGEELPITEVSLSEVTAQYLTYIETVEDNQAEEISDFLVVAAKLLFLKSKYLIPLAEVEDDEGPRLEDQLKCYQVFVDASKKIEDIWQPKAQLVGREEPHQYEVPETVPENVTVGRLRRNMVQLLERIRPPKPLPKTKIDKAISLKKTISHISTLLKKRKRIRFSELVPDKKNKTQLIVGFLAVLELMKQHSVEVTQEIHFGEVRITRIKH